MDTVIKQLRQKQKVIEKAHFMEEKLEKELEKIQNDIQDINSKKIALVKEMDLSKKEDEDYQKKLQKLRIYDEEMIVFQSQCEEYENEIKYLHEYSQKNDFSKSKNKGKLNEVMKKKKKLLESFLEEIEEFLSSMLKLQEKYNKLEA